MKKLSFQSLKQQFWPLCLGVACLLLVTGLLSAGVIGLYYYTKIPVTAYHSVNQAPWAYYNVSLYQVQNPIKLHQIGAELEKVVSIQHKQGQDSPLPYILLGRYYRQTGDYPTAIQSFNQSIALINKDWLSAYYYQHFTDNINAELAMLYYFTDDLSKSTEALAAIEDFENMENPDLLLALQQRLDEPKQGGFHFQLAQQLRSILYVKQAIEELKLAKATVIDPAVKSDIETYEKTKLPLHLTKIKPEARYFLMAGVFNETIEGDVARASEYYQMASHLEPQLEWAYTQLGISAYKQRKYRQAMEAAYQAISLNPETISPYLTLGDIEIDRSNYSLAIAHYSKALTLSQAFQPQAKDALEANIQNQIGFAYEQLGEKEPATIHYKQALAQALENSSDYQYSEEALARIKQAG